MKQLTSVRSILTLKKRKKGGVRGEEKKRKKSRTTVYFTWLPGQSLKDSVAIY